MSTTMSTDFIPQSSTFTSSSSLPRDMHSHPDTQPSSSLSSSPPSSPKPTRLSLKRKSPESEVAELLASQFSNNDVISSTLSSAAIEGNEITSSMEQNAVAALCKEQTSHLLLASLPSELSFNISQTFSSIISSDSLNSSSLSCLSNNSNGSSSSAGAVSTTSIKRAKVNLQKDTESRADNEDGTVNCHDHSTATEDCETEGNEKERRYKCSHPGCDKTFFKPYNLRTHLRSHTKEKPFECEHCGEKFTRRHDADRHFKTKHQGIKAYSCVNPGCDKSYSRVSSLTIHYKNSESCRLLLSSSSGKQGPETASVITTSSDNSNRTHTATSSLYDVVIPESDSPVGENETNNTRSSCDSTATANTSVSESTASNAYNRYGHNNASTNADGSTAEPEFKFTFPPHLLELYASHFASGSPSVADTLSQSESQPSTGSNTTLNTVATSLQSSRTDLLPESIAESLTASNGCSASENGALPLPRLSEMFLSQFNAFSDSELPQFSQCQLSQIPFCPDSVTSDNQDSSSQFSTSQELALLADKTSTSPSLNSTTAGSIRTSMTTLNYMRHNQSYHQPVDPTEIESSIVPLSIPIASFEQNELLQYPDSQLQTLNTASSTEQNQCSEQIVESESDQAGSETKSTEKSRKYLCPVAGCGAAFAKRFNLKSHMKVHTGVKEFNCDKCDKVFGRKHDLVRHVQVTHENYRPFTCPVCGKGFGRKSNLDSHLDRNPTCKHSLPATSAAVSLPHANTTSHRNMRQPLRSQLNRAESRAEPGLNDKVPAAELTMADELEAVEGLIGSLNEFNEFSGSVSAGSLNLDRERRVDEGVENLTGRASRLGVVGSGDDKELHDALNRMFGA